MPEQFGEKAHEATPHRREQARKKGQVPKSQDLGAAALLLLGTAALMYMGGSIIDFVAGLTTDFLGGDARLSIDRETVVAQWREITWDLAQAILPFFAILFAIAVLSSVGQTGLLFVPSRLAPDLNRLNPLKGLSRIFSLSGLVRLSFGLFKIMVIAGVAFGSLYAKREEVLALPSLALPQFAVYLLDIVSWTVLKISGVLLVLALLDLAFQRWKHEDDLRMTTHELKEEMKHTQGNPETAQRRRALRQLARQQLTQAVPQSEFVLTNPTELAIAIAYDPKTMKAPVVAAKGAGLMAQRIRRIALENGIPIIERKPLAQALYKHVDINQPIPEKFYQAVGEVVRYVYELKGKSLPGVAS